MAETGRAADRSAITIGSSMASPDVSTAPQSTPDITPVRKPQRWLKRLIVRISIYLTLYVLSIGPMYWYWYGAYNLDKNSWLVAFYLPLMFACEIPFIGDFVNWYIQMWIF